MAIWVIKYLKRVKHIINPLSHFTAEALLIPSPLREEAVFQWEFQTQGFLSRQHTMCVCTLSGGFLSPHQKSKQASKQKKQDCLRLNEFVKQNKTKI